MEEEEVELKGGEERKKGRMGTEEASGVGGQWEGQREETGEKTQRFSSATEPESI